jgi:type VI secretion system protein ImpI
MALTLRVENQTSLSDGGPLSVTIQGKRGIDIGRDQYLDWTLPDPDRVVSGKHCEIRWRDNAYWLNDTSTNGTFLVGAETRLPVPYRIRNGDRFVIGHYVVAATVEGETADAIPAPAAASNLSYDEIWNTVGDVAPPMNPRQLKPSRDVRPAKADFLEWAVDVPASAPPRSSPSPGFPEPFSKAPFDDWSQGVRREAPPRPAAAPMPEPRRPVWTGGELEQPWGATPQPTAERVMPAVDMPSAAPVQVAPTARAESQAKLDAERQRQLPRELDSPPPASGRDLGTEEFVRLFSQGAGLPANVLSGCDPTLLAEQVGQLLRLLTENTKLLLEERQQAKRMARSSDHTTIQALNNNPLKFAPTAEEAMRVMFGPPNRSYLDARAAFSQSFDNLKSHQVQTYAAMQHALRALLAEFDPETIEKGASGDRGLTDMLGSPKARLWDAYVSHWKVRTQGRKDAALSAFMNYFAEHYDLEEFRRDR